MKGKKLSSYAAILIISLFGGGATMLIVDAAYSSNAAYEAEPFDPTDPEADFERGRNATSTDEQA